MVIKLTDQAHFGTDSYPQEHNKHTLSLLLEGLHQIFDSTLIGEALHVVMRPNYPEINATVFHPSKVTPTEGDIPKVMPTRQPTLIFVKWVKTVVCSTQCVCVCT